jgi:hypothetical protein
MLKKDRRSGLKLVVGGLFGFALLAGTLLTNEQDVVAADVVVYKSPTCGCCNAWVDHLKESGFTVETRDQQKMNEVKNELGVPRNLRSCHTAQVGGYLVEGHVPADLITKMLQDKPEIAGLSVPGMPMGSPGMEGHRSDPYDILAFKKGGQVQIFDSRN